MGEEPGLDPDDMEMIEGTLRHLASLPVPYVEIAGERVSGLWLLREMREDLPEGLRKDLERDLAIIGGAKVGMVPALVDGEEKFKHKDLLTPEDLPLVAAWHDIEAERLEQRAKRARFAAEALEGLEELGRMDEGEHREDE